LFYAAILLLVLRASQLDRGFQLAAALVGEQNMASPLRCFSAAMTFYGTRVLFALLRNPACACLDALRPSAYGIYLVHYIFIIWPAIRRLRSAASRRLRRLRSCFAGALSLSWGAHAAVTEDSVGSADDLGSPNLVTPGHRSL